MSRPWRYARRFSGRTHECIIQHEMLTGGSKGAPTREVAQVCNAIKRRQASQSAQLPWFTTPALQVRTRLSHAKIGQETPVASVLVTFEELP